MQNMKVFILSSGVNKLKVIKLIRHYSGKNLKEAKYIYDNQPIAFTCKYPYEKMHEIINAFENISCKIKIETEESKSKDKKKIDIKSRLLEGKLDYKKNTDLLEDLLVGEVDIKTEKTELNSIDEIIVFLKKRQNFRKAVYSGIISSIILLMILSVFFYESNFYYSSISIWITNLIIGMIISFSIRKKGNGIENKFGYLAAGLTIITCFVLSYINYATNIIVENLNYIFLFRFNILSQNDFLLSLSTAATVSYISAFEQISRIKKKKSKLEKLRKK